MQHSKHHRQAHVHRPENDDLHDDMSRHVKSPSQHNNEDTMLFDDLSHHVTFAAQHSNEERILVDRTMKLMGEDDDFWTRTYDTKLYEKVNQMIMIMFNIITSDNDKGFDNELQTFFTQIESIAVTCSEHPNSLGAMVVLDVKSLIQHNDRLKLQMPHVASFDPQSNKLMMLNLIGNPIILLIKSFQNK